jgi:DNA-binding transcriptional LysR family regulator
MKINNLGLLAFYHAAMKLHMTEAASLLGITQSALSQRIKALEDDLETTLFIREGKSLSLTDAGEDLLKFCHSQMSLEGELLSKLRSDKGEVAGILRIAAYSSVLRSLIIPKLTPYLREHDAVTVEFSSHEVEHLYAVLKSGEADLVVSDGPMNRKGIIEKTLGQEEYVVIESVKYSDLNKDVYLDHHAQDKVTEEFFDFQNHIPKYRRSFMGDVYGIVEGVENGLGRAVMSKHLVLGNKKVKILNGFKKYHRPIILHYFERPFYPRILNEVIALVTKE